MKNHDIPKTSETFPQRHPQITRVLELAGGWLVMIVLGFSYLLVHAIEGTPQPGEDACITKSPDGC